VVILIVMGPDRLPDLARMAGKVIRELRSLGSDLQDHSQDTK